MKLYINNLFFMEYLTIFKLKKISREGYELNSRKVSISILKFNSKKYKMGFVS